VGEQKKEKTELLQILNAMDGQAEVGELSPTEWEYRYEIEYKLEQIFHREELYWQQRGDENWVLRGDANTQFFHQYANGRRRKNLIRSLENEHGVLRSQEDIENHATAFYKNLFGSTGDACLRLMDHFWFLIQIASSSLKTSRRRR